MRSNRHSAEHAHGHAPLAVEALRLVSVSHHTAALAELERVALTVEAQASLRAALAERGMGAVVLCTCNRTELYWASRGPDDDAFARAALAERLPAGDAEAPVTSMATGRATAAHLFRVTAGLESRILGEYEIVGQVRGALEDAESHGAAGPLLSRLFRAALEGGRRARTETRIGDGALSVASAAVRTLRRTRPDLESLRVLVLGVGATGLKVARHLSAERVGRLVLVNRTRTRAEAVAPALGAEVAALESLPERLAEADALVAAVRAPDRLVTRELLSAARAGHDRPLAIFDLSLPRAVEPEAGTLPGIALHDLASFEDMVAATRARRAGEVPRVEALLDATFERFAAGLERRRAFTSAPALEPGP